MRSEAFFISCDPAGIIKIPAKPAMKAEIPLSVSIGLRIGPL